MPIIFLLFACNKKSDGVTPSKADPKTTESKSSQIPVIVTPLKMVPSLPFLNDEALLASWNSARAIASTKDSQAASLEIFRKILKESPEKLALLIRATKPGNFRESMLLELSDKASVKSIVSVAQQIGDQLDEREWNHIGIGLRVQKKDTGRNKEAFMAARDTTNSPEIKHYLDRALGFAISSVDELPFAETLTAGATEATVDVAEAAFREIGRQAPEKLWTAATDYNTVAQREARKAALKGMIQNNSFEFTAQFVTSHAEDQSVRPLSAWVIDRWLSADPLTASSWVDKNGNKDLFITVSEFCQGRGDLEAAKVWRAKAK